MTEETAFKHLLAHFMHRINEFFNENNPEEIANDGELGTRFARWLFVKDCPNAPFKTAQGLIAQHLYSEQVADSESITMARLMLFQKHGVGLMWMGDLFINREMPMPDELREQIVTTLRYHADKIESREIDARMKQIQESQTGTA